MPDPVISVLGEETCIEKRAFPVKLMDHTKHFDDVTVDYWTADSICRSVAFSR